MLCRLGEGSSYAEGDQIQRYLPQGFLKEAGRVEVKSEEVDSASDTPDKSFAAAPGSNDRKVETH